MTDEQLNLGRLLSAMEAERVLGIPAATIRSWHHRRTSTGLWSAGRDNRRHPVFWEADLVARRDRKRIRDREGRRLVTRPDVR